VSICAGTPLIAPKGYKALEAGATYYFLRSSPKKNWVTLVEFVLRQPKQVVYKAAKRPERTVAQLPLPKLVRIQRADFEDGVFDGQIVPGERKLMPPWLDGLEGIDLEAVDGERKRPAKRHSDRIDDKLFTFHALLLDVEGLLDVDDVDQAINRHARALKPAQNETRVRLWFFTYIAFGRNRNALHYPIHRLGRWNRLEVFSKVKRGAPGQKGAAYGHNTTKEMREKIILSYSKLAGLGYSDETTYVRAMKEYFGCKSRWAHEGGRKWMEIHHPEGKPFPQKGAYFYHVNVRFRPHLVQETRLGRNRARSKIKPVLGTFTESSWNLMQRVEADAYRVFDLPRGYVEGSDLPPLVVVTKRDTASGRKTGIGFSQGSETGAAYRMATFCQAIGLEAFGRLLGLKVRASGKGISPHDITDRGPGATPSGRSRDSALLPVISEQAPAYAGQSKALIETSNPKTPSNDEAPSYRRSGLTVVALARREFANLLQFNEATNVANRVDPALEHRVTRLSPNGIWEALDAVGRNDAVQISFDDAVRAYLDLVPARLTRSGLEVAGRNYYSKSAEFESALSSVSGNDGVDVKAYVLTACVRHVWFEWDHRLIELDVRYPIPVGSEVKYMSFWEATQYAEHMERRKAEFAGHQRGVRLHSAEDYEAQTGLKLDAGQRVTGRPKRGSAVARQEAQEAARSAAGRKAA
jgi:hypothetical protein